MHTAHVPSAPMHVSSVPRSVSALRTDGLDRMSTSDRRLRELRKSMSTGSYRLQRGSQSVRWHLSANIFRAILRLVTGSFRPRGTTLWNAGRRWNAPLIVERSVIGTSDRCGIRRASCNARTGQVPARYRVSAGRAQYRDGMPGPVPQIRCRVSPAIRG